MTDVVILRQQSVVTLISGQPRDPVVGNVSSNVIIQRSGIPGLPGRDGLPGPPGVTTIVYTGDLPEVIDGGNF